MAHVKEVVDGESHDDLEGGDGKDEADTVPEGRGLGATVLRIVGIVGKGDEVFQDVGRGRLGDRAHQLAKGANDEFPLKGGVERAHQRSFVALAYPGLEVGIKLFFKGVHASLGVDEPYVVCL